MFLLVKKPHLIVLSFIEIGMKQTVMRNLTNFDVVVLFLIILLSDIGFISRDNVKVKVGIGL